MEDMIVTAASVFPERLKSAVLKASEYAEGISEIRFIADKSVFFVTSEGIRFISLDGYIQLAPDRNTLVPDRNELEEMVDRASGFSGFFYEKQLREGFITYAGACRMGICASSEGDNFAYGTINSLAVRIPAFSLNLFGDIFPLLAPLAEKGILVAGSPGSGKTTLLRILAVRLSDAYLGKFSKVAVIDERGELSAGGSLGFCTDIIGGKNKGAAILHAVRLMAPQYVICDEIGSSDEAEAVTQGLNSGISFITSMHAGSMTELVRRAQFRKLYDIGAFQTVALLTNALQGRKVRIFTEEEINNEIRRADGSLSGNRSFGNVFSCETVEENKNSLMSV